MSRALWIPGATREPLAVNPSRDPKIIPVGAVFHIAVSESADLHDFFDRRSDGIESTGYIRRDGKILQYRPLNVECDAQGDGNSWVKGGIRYGLTSWETQGMGDGEWTDAQLASIKFIIMQHHIEWSVPLRVNPGPNDSGFGYHRLFKAWNKNAHSCPGDDRVKQFEHTIRPWLAAGGDRKAPRMTPAQKFKAQLLAACKQAKADVPAGREVVHDVRREVEALAAKIK